VDNRNEKINYKVREHSVSKIPIIAVVGDKEIKTRSINIRRLGQKNSLTMSLDDAIRELSLEATPPDIKKEKESQNKSFVNNRT
jgi:threonyl-tRNA synthetase